MKPKYYWYGFVKKLIAKYPDDLDLDTSKGAEAYLCVRKALNDTARMRDGADRIKVVEMVLIGNTHTAFAAADRVHVSERTALRWVSAFVYLVADKLGYL